MKAALVFSTFYKWKSEAQEVKQLHQVTKSQSWDLIMAPEPTIFSNMFKKF